MWRPQGNLGAAEKRAGPRLRSFGFDGRQRRRRGRGRGRGYLGYAPRAR